MRWVTAAAALVNIYSFAGLAFVLALYAFPLMFIFVKSALDLVSSEMEDAANILGAGIWTTTRKVTLPLVLPAILGGVIIVFLETVALFGTPAILGIPARINVVTTQLWQFFEYPVRVEVAAAYAMPLLLITVVLIGGQRMLLSRRGYVAQTGKGGERRPIELGRWRWALLAYCGLVGAMAVVMPLLVLLQASFAKAWGRGLSFDNLTFANYTYLIFRHEMALPSIWNTLWFSAAAATAAVLIALLVAYVAARRLVPFANVLGLHRHGAVRDPGHRHGDRLLCRLRGPAGVAVRHVGDRHPGLHRALPADRLRQRQCGDPRSCIRRWRRRRASSAAAACTRCAG